MRLLKAFVTVATLGNAACAFGQNHPQPTVDKVQTGAQLPQAQIEWKLQDKADLPIEWRSKLTVQKDGSLLLTDPRNLSGLPLILQQQTVPTARISIDLNERIQGALTKLFRQVNLRFELDKDIPANTRVTMRVRNVSFLTALRAMLEQADLGWTVTTSSEAKMPRAVYRIGKQPTLLQTMPIVDPNLAPLNIPWRVQKGNLLTLPKIDESQPVHIEWDHTKLLLTPAVDPHPASPVFVPGHSLQTKPVLPTTKIVDTTAPVIVQPTVQDQAPNSKIDTHAAKVPILGDLPIIGSLFTTRTRTERSIFTCPNCHEQVTVVRSREAPTCPDCGRQFQTNWKVCPFDGAKRPVIAGEWKYCPVCGKTLTEKRKTQSGQ